MKEKRTEGEGKNFDGEFRQFFATAINTSARRGRHTAAECKDRKELSKFRLTGHAIKNSFSLNRTTFEYSP